MVDAQKSAENGNEFLTITPEREAAIWRHWIGIWADRSVDEQGMVDVETLSRCVHAKLRPLFRDRSDQLNEIFLLLRGQQHATKELLLNTLCPHLQALRREAYSSYPEFESQLRSRSVKVGGFIPLTRNNMIGYSVVGNEVHIHIQHSYSIIDKLRTFDEGMRALAVALEQRRELAHIKRIEMNSWMFRNRQSVLDAYGLTVDPERPECGCISVEDFKRRWLKDGTDQSATSPITAGSSAP